MNQVLQLYSAPLPAKRTGALYSACSYPTKISPESIAIFIASHTEPGDTVLDVFGGSGTTGLAVHLCAQPTKEVIVLADQLGLQIKWGPRHAIVQELGAWGAFIAQVMCNPPEAAAFLAAADRLRATCEAKIGSVYATVDDRGAIGRLRYAIWSDILACPTCGQQTPFWDAVVTLAPVSLSSQFVCPRCHKVVEADRAERVVEDYRDRLTGQLAQRRKRVLRRIYGQTNGRNWSRAGTRADEDALRAVDELPLPPNVPIAQIPWGDLYRAGYHRGITHAHHFYTPRNLLVLATLWDEIAGAPAALQDALKLLVLSYNATHSTLMTRVVVKQGQRDFVVTGAQSGVLYVSSLPVEKNILEGLRRKAKTIAAAFALVNGSQSTVQVVNGSSTKLDLPDRSVDYVFTDPPFGDYIPYAEISFLNEVWLGPLTDTQDEAIISAAQHKPVAAYTTLMAAVFQEVTRVLKDDGAATVVFHSAKASIWQALQHAYRSAGFQVARSSVLDKVQTSFKQTNSEVIVRGDPLLLLTKQPHNVAVNGGALDPAAVLAELWAAARDAGDEKERTPERLYARFVARFLEHGSAVPLDASRFYAQVGSLQKEGR